MGSDVCSLAHYNDIKEKKQRKKAIGIVVIWNDDSL
jgi:hypothetical protein